MLHNPGSMEAFRLGAGRDDRAKTGDWKLYRLDAEGRASSGNTWYVVSRSRNGVGKQCRGATTRVRLCPVNGAALKRRLQLGCRVIARAGRQAWARKVKVW